MLGHLLSKHSDHRFPGVLIGIITGDTNYEIVDHAGSITFEEDHERVKTVLGLERSCGLLASVALR